MCGIAGVVYAEPERSVDRVILERMAGTIAHRGPDSAGYWHDAGVGLAHRRLSIIDLETGRQPVGNEDNSLQVVFNGEIYNYRELRQRLEDRGHRFRTFSDTEVLVHLYEEHGEHLVDHLRGMFAFALWDTRKRRLLLARDRIGIKPVFVYHDAQMLVFGSELKPILAHPGIGRDVDPRAISDYMTYGVIPGSKSIFRGIKKLLPGHTLTLDVAGWRMRCQQYWRLQFEPDESLNVSEWKEAINDSLRESVDLHLVSDVPVGAFLSGGIDSSLIVSEASALSCTPLQTFSVGFAENRFNELPFARQIARQFGTEHVEQIVSAEAASLVDILSHFYDEPFADSSAIPTYLLSEIASQYVKVVLSGDGGDEALGGYSRYSHDLREHSLRQLIPSWLCRPWLMMLSRMWPRADWLPRPLRWKNLLQNLSLNPASAYANTLSLCRHPLHDRLLSRDIRNAIGSYDASQHAIEGFAQAPTNEPLSGMIAADFATLLPDDYLTKVDRASMAHGLEVRPPMLDHKFLELCARVPSRFKVNSGETKWLLRELSRAAMPPSITDRPKQGFEIPIDRWFRESLTDLFESRVLSSGAAVADFIDQALVEKLWQSHRRGTSRHGTLLWMLLTLATWSERYLRTPNESYQTVVPRIETGTRALPDSAIAVTETSS